MTVDGGRRLEPAQRRLRARSAGHWVIDTTETWLLFEPGRHPVFMLPVAVLPALDMADATADERDGRWVALAGRPDRRVRLWSDAPADLPALHGLAAMPATDVAAGMLRPAARRTRCQYKGEAVYWDVVTDSATHAAVAWGYPQALGDARALAGHLAFAPWDPAVVTTVDGVVAQVAAPQPHWSNPSSHLPARAG